ncbi:hypothetical protein [Intestinimonas sp.]|uniref:hypothetical protein n=1 Tax=Intestinimonas sp. TaxID=1965293 RepID=UPI002637E092|nr:hypothetical protein [Intestinimonas sp.]
MDKEKRAADKRAARNHKEDIVLNRVLIWFGAAVVAELVLLLLNRYYINVTTAPGEIEFAGALLKAWPVLIGVTAVGAALCLFWSYFWAKGGKRITLPAILAGVFFVGLVISVVTYRFYATGVQFLCGAVPAAAVLALVYYLYQHEFFAVTVLSALGLVGLWLFRRAGGGHQTLVYAYVAVLAVILVGTVLLCRSLSAKDGVLTLGGKKLQLFSRSASYGMIYLTCAVVAVAVAAALLLGTAVAYYLIFALVAWIFIMAVYYTVKLM